MKNFLKITMIALMAIVVLSPTAFAETLSRQLQVGIRGNDVSSLQTFLASDRTLYPQGLVTGYFGFLTKSAVANFQSRNNLAADGIVGPRTLPVLNAQMNGFGPGERDAPTISNINLNNSTAGSATISWNTNELARSKVYYQTSFPTISEITSMGGKVSISGTSASDETLKTSQNLTMTGLQSGITYYYSVISTDANGNEEMVWPTTFVAK